MITAVGEFALLHLFHSIVERIDLKSNETSDKNGWYCGFEKYVTQQFGHGLLHPIYYTKTEHQRGQIDDCQQKQHS